MAGHGVRAASEAVDLEAGGNSLGSRVLDAGAKTRTGGDLIPEETDPWDPAPRALAPEEPEGRVARRTMVRCRRGAVSSTDERSGSTAARHGLWVGFHSGRTSLLRLSHVGFLAESGNVEAGVFLGRADPHRGEEVDDPQDDV